MTLTFVTLSLLAMLVLRMPIAFAMGIAGAAGMAIQVGVVPTMSLFERMIIENTSQFILVAIPLFILMAEFMTAGGMTTRAVTACQAWLGHFRGGLAMATVGAAVMLAALIGSSTASSATMASSAYPEMRRFRYDDRLSTAIISAGGTLAVMIPPSIVLIVYGVLTETSIGKLFIAGIVPGLLTASGLIVTIIFLASGRRLAPPGDAFDLRVALRQSSSVWPMCLLIVLVIASIYTGTASPTEAGAVGAAGALLLAILQRTMRFNAFSAGLSHAIQTTVFILAIIYCSSIFATYLTYSQATQGLILTVQESALSPGVILLIIIVIMLALGTLLDQLAILSLTMPLVFPLVTALGYDPIWFGIVVTKTVEIGLLTPPLGLNVFITAGRTGVPAKTVFRGVTPFLITEGVILTALVLFPDIALWLPRQMG